MSKLGSTHVISPCPHSSRPPVPRVTRSALCPRSVSTSSAHSWSQASVLLVSQFTPFPLGSLPPHISTASFHFPHLHTHAHTQSHVHHYTHLNLESTCEWTRTICLSEPDLLYCNNLYFYLLFCKTPWFYFSLWPHKIPSRICNTLFSTFVLIYGQTSRLIPFLSDPEWHSNKPGC